MPVYPNNHLYPKANILTIEAPFKSRNIFLDATPARTPQVPGNEQQPIIFVNNLVDANFSKDVVYSSIKPVLIMLKVMGVLPLNKPGPSINTFSLTSTPTIYSFGVIAALICYVLYFSIYKVEIMRSTEGKFEEAVIEYLFTVYLFPVIVIPLMWYETRKIADLLNSWADFEITFRRLAGKPIPIQLYKKALGIAIIIPTLSTISVCVTHLTMAHFKAIQVAPYVFLEVTTYLLGGYWYLLCECLSKTAHVLAEDFQQALRHIGPAGKVGEYRALWLRLSKLARDTGMANCYSFIFISLYLFLIITLSIYGLMSQISDGFGVKDVGLALTAFCSVTLLFFICDEAHYASQNVKTIFQKKLLMVELSWMSNDAQTEVNMFLRATEMNPSHVSLGGFLDVNRNLFKSMLATMVTYLVVLLQFQISIPEDTTTSTNATLKT